jgi:hypothetical protein
MVRTVLSTTQVILLASLPSGMLLKFYATGARGRTVNAEAVCV